MPGVEPCPGFDDVLHAKRNSTKSKKLPSCLTVEAVRIVSYADYTDTVFVNLIVAESLLFKKPILVICSCSLRHPFVYRISKSS